MAKQKLKLLHLGCGNKRQKDLPKELQDNRFKEIRFDKDASVKPDIVGDIRDLSSFEANSIDIIYAANVLPYLHSTEIVPMLKQCQRIMAEGATLFVSAPDVRSVAFHIAANAQNFTKNIYGESSPLTLLYGANAATQPATAFSSHSLAQILLDQQFYDVKVTCDDEFFLWAKAIKPSAAMLKNRPIGNVSVNYPFALTPLPEAGTLSDNLDAQPKKWQDK